MADKVTPELIKQYREDGAICLRGVFDKKWLDIVDQGMKRVEESPSGEAVTCTTEGGAKFFQDYCNWQRIPEFQDYIHNSPAKEIVGLLMETEYVNFYFDHTLIKEPGTSKKTPWHHDQAYQPMEGYKNISIWMPINPVTKENTLYFVKGSHNWKEWFYPVSFATTCNYETVHDDVTNRTYQNVPDIDGNPDKYQLLGWAMEPGDCVIFHNKCLHGAPGNPSQLSSRRVFATRWLGDDSRLAKRPWEAAPPMMGGLNFGDKIIDCQTFPEVWRRK